MAPVLSGLDKTPCKHRVLSQPTSTMLKLRLRSSQIRKISLDRPAARCIVAAHAAGQRIVLQAPRGAGTLARAAHGGAAARERYPQPASPAQARPQSRTSADPRAAAQSPRLSRDGEGLRPAVGGAEVRPREGQQDPVAVPDL